MSPRRSPVRHLNRAHIRKGVPVKKYEKGSRKADKQAKSSRGVSRDSGFNVTLIFTDQPRETVNVGGNTYTAGTKAGLQAMRTPSVPVRMQLRRRKR